MRRLSDQALQRFIGASVSSIQLEVIEAVSASEVRRAQSAAIDEQARREYMRRVEKFKEDVAGWSARNCSEMAFAARMTGLTVAVSAADAIETFVCTDD